VSLGRKILKVLTQSVVRRVGPSGQIVKNVMRDAAPRCFVFSQLRKHETMTLTFYKRKYRKSDTGPSPQEGILRHSSFPKTLGARAGHDPSVCSAEMSRIGDRSYVVHQYLDQLPSQPPEARRPLALTAVELPSSNESHPMDHDSNSSGHTRIKSLPPQPDMQIHIGQHRRNWEVETIKSL